jgi:hypothetical protein
LFGFTGKHDLTGFEHGAMAGDAQGNRSILFHKDSGNE